MTVSSEILSKIELDSKSLFAKLLAREDIFVRFSLKATTASFSLDSRTLTLPIYQNLSKNVTDMFVVHEISHALFTPNEWVTDDIVRRVSGSEDIFKHAPRVRELVNVLEDPRIEKLARRRYPGTARLFREGYAELVTGDKFFSKRSKWKTLPFPDRLLIALKIVPAEFPKLPPFSPDEQKFLDAGLATETWEDVLKLATLLYSSFYPEGSEAVPETETDPESNDPVMSDSSDPTEEESNSGTTEQSSLSSIQVNFLKANIASTDEEISYIFLDKLPLDEVLVPYKEFWRRYTGCSTSNYNRTGYLHAFSRENRALLDTYVAEFHRWKSAKEFEGARISKTGRIDPLKLSCASLTDDIFLKKTISFTAKNHGLVLFIDWSGSMNLGSNNTTIEDTLKQAMILTEFCRRCGLPFEVYLFDDNLDLNNSLSSYAISPMGSSRCEEPPYVGYTKCNLVQILHDAMTPVEYSTALSHLLELGRSFSVHLNRFFNPYPPAHSLHSTWVETPAMASRPSWMTLGGTPTISSMVFLPQLFDRFRKRTSVEQLSFILLTDGAPTDRFPYKAVISYQGVSKGVGSSTALLDIAEFLNDNCNVNVIGLYVASTQAADSLRSYATMSLERKWKRSRKKPAMVAGDGYRSVTISGFDEFFVVPSSSLRMQMADMAERLSKKMSKSRIAETFSSGMKSNRASRVFATNFMRLVGVGR
jgi:hypothetical protein